MTFVPAVPLGGMAGWAMLQRTRTRQMDALRQSPEIKRDAAYFRANIGGVSSAADLVADRRLLKVALAAFGLQEDIGNRFFLRKVLESDLSDRTALANKLSDKRYREFAQAFGFGGPEPPRTATPAFADRIITRFEARTFEAAVGKQDQNLRLALSMESELAGIAGRDVSADGRWFMVMGMPPLRKVFEVALGLPPSLGRLDLDQQLRTFRAAAERVLGHSEIADISRPEGREKLIRHFLVRAELSAPGAASPFVRGAAALSLLQGAAAPLLG